MMQIVHYCPFCTSSTQPTDQEKKMQTVHFIQSHKSLVLWQRDHYSYEIQDRKTGKILARPESFELALAKFYEIRDAAEQVAA